MLIPRVLAHFLLFVPEFRWFFLVVLRLSSRMLRLMIARVGTLYSTICPKVSVFFASTLKVALQNATNNNTQVLGRIVCNLFQTLFFLSSFKVGF